MIGDAFEFMKARPVPGVLCEFGVYQGLGLQSIAQCSQQYLGGGIPIYGFDTFEGMPKTRVRLYDLHAEVWRPGGYADTSMQAVHRLVPEVRLIKGNFRDLPPLTEFGISQVRFARLDCDLYESYKDALLLLTPCIASGTVLLFDEVVAIDDPRYHDSIRDSGERAVREWQEASGFRLEVLQNVGTESLTVVK